MNRQGGFTLVEVIVVAAIIAILAGVLVPLILKEIDEARITRAAADIRSISVAMMVMKKDTGKWPVRDPYNACSSSLTYINGEGNTPLNYDVAGFNIDATANFDEIYSTDSGGCYGTLWKGPYMAHVGEDPWGNSYIVNVDGFTNNSPVWIISAGPNGSVDTSVASTTLVGDDVGSRLR